MKLYYFTIITSLLFVGCASNAVTNKNESNLTFSQIKSSFEVEDTNNYGCKNIRNSDLKHVFENGILASPRDVHDNYSFVGCSIKGQLSINGKDADFTFDYGGIIYLSNETILVCGESCCKNNFEYCTWDSK